MKKENNFDQLNQILEEIISAPEQKLSMQDTFLLFMVDAENEKWMKENNEFKENVKKKRLNQLRYWNEIFKQDYDTFKNKMINDFRENKEKIKSELTHISIEKTNNVLLIFNEMLDNEQRIENGLEFLTEKCSDDDYKEIMIVINKAEKLYLSEYLSTCRYFLGENFNKEAIIMFLYSNINSKLLYDEDFFILNRTIQKTQKLFENMYKELKVASPQTNIILGINIDIPREIKEFYVNAPLYENPDDPCLLYFRLKKLIALYKFYYSASTRKIGKKLDSTLDWFNKILVETKLARPFYVKKGNLIEYITSTLSITQVDLAKLFGFDKSNISQYKNLDKIPRDRLWVFESISYFSHSFLCGETTIPFWGKQYNNSVSYVTTVTMQRYFSQYILLLAMEFMKYQKSLSDPKITKKIDISKDFRDDLSIKYLAISQKLIKEGQSLSDQYFNVELERKKLLEEKARYENDHSPSIDGIQRKYQEMLNYREEKIALEKNKIEEFRKNLLKKLDDILSIINKTSCSTNHIT